MRHYRSVVVPAGLALLSAYFMVSAYQRARHDAIQQLYAQERILAEQAAQGITSYFSYYRQTLEFLAGSDEVVASGPAGRRLLQDLFTSQRNNLLSLTRVGPDGRILYTYPEEQATGRLILDQPHVQAVFATKRPVVSSVFTSVQGFECVAIHVPVFDHGTFAGSLAALIPFVSVSRRYLEGVRLGDTGSALLLSREGVELYCPIPGHTGRRVTETLEDFPSALAMAGRMLSGETGTAAFDYPRGVSPDVQTVTTHAHFTRIPLEDTYWTVAVTATETEALTFIQGFRNQWAIGFALLFVALFAWGLALARAYLRLGREEARKVAQDRVLAAERARERALRESEEQFRRYFEDSILAMAITAPTKRWVLVNVRLSQLLGYSRDELMALDWADLTHPDDLAADLGQFDRMLAGEIDGYSLEKRFVRKDGAIVHTILSVRLVRRADGAPDHCLAQLQDITDRKRHEEERAQLAEQLRQSQKLEAIGQLAGGVAHDFNNLLAVQLGYLELIAEQDLPAALRGPLGEVEKSAKLAAQLTSQLLAFGRRQVLHVERLDLRETVLAVTAMLRRVLPETIALDVEPAPRSLWIDADPGSVEQVIMNLVVNARDAMPEGGALRLTMGEVDVDAAHLPPGEDVRPGRFVFVEVADSGEGMDEDTRQRVFEPFFTTKAPGKGTGLGLAMVYGIVRQHRGWIDLRTSPGHGAAFRVHFEAADVPPDVVVEPSGPARSSDLRGRGETVLVAEDNDSVRRMLAKMLERLGYRALPADGAAEAMRLWREHAADVRLLLSDMVMLDGEGGLDLARRLRTDRPDLPVVIMSGYSEDLVGSMLDADMTFLHKPWTRDSLAKAVHEALRAGARGEVVE